MAQSDESKLAEVESKIAKYPDFPVKGVLFRDIMPVMNYPSTFAKMIDLLHCRTKDLQIDRILGIESRGFLLAPLLAQKMQLPFSPIRKKGKLPGELYSIEYELEYGKDTLEVQKNGLPKGSKCLVVDDLIATGGSLQASSKLIEMSGSKVAAFAVIIELEALNGKDKLGQIPLLTLFKY